VLGVSIGNGGLAGVSPLSKVEGRKIFGLTIRHDAEPCRRMSAKGRRVPA
jgi:hypothetical protein